MRVPLRGRALRIAASFLLIAGASACGSNEPRTIAVSIEHSRFSPASITVSTGEQVRFVLTNADPIDHEFIIGSQAEQRAHEHGTEGTHDGAPGAASLSPGERQTITHTFATRGALEYACHLPGHYAYGMKGRLTVGGA